MNFYQLSLSKTALFFATIAQTFSRISSVETSNFSSTQISHNNASYNFDPLGLASNASFHFKSSGSSDIDPLDLLKKVDFKKDEVTKIYPEFDILLQKKDDELKKILNPKQLGNLAIYISATLIDEYGGRPSGAKNFAEFGDDEKANIVKALNRSADFMESSSKAQLIENLENLKKSGGENFEKTNKINVFLHEAFADFLTASYQRNQDEISESEIKKDALKKFVAMIESSEVDKSFSDDFRRVKIGFIRSVNQDEFANSRFAPTGFDNIEKEKSSERKSEL